jgi:uncharacterized membrane protein YvlD (DUF360 family)
LTDRDPLVSSLKFPVGAFGWFGAFVRARYLPIVSRFTPKREAISRFECPALWSVMIESISAIVSRFAIQDLLQQRFVEG